MTLHRCADGGPSRVTDTTDRKDDRPKTWVSVRDDTSWAVDVLPFAVARFDGRRRVVSRIGDLAVDLAPIAQQLAPHLTALFETDSLNTLMSQPPATWHAVWSTVQSWLVTGSMRRIVEPHLLAVAHLDLTMPFTVADFVDFSSSRFHAEHAAKLLRPGSPALHANWLHLPIGYHGRSGSVVVTGTRIARPTGQMIDDGDVVFERTRCLDFEAEVGFVIGTPSPAGQRLDAAHAPEHVFGVVLVNDWSARDLQAWEATPLGPFVSKAFATSISAWVTPMWTLRRARVSAPPRGVAQLPHLSGGDDWGLDIELEVSINGHVVSRPPFGHQYWTIAHQLAHLTSAGASLRTGDLIASGTVSGPHQYQAGSLMELTAAGTQPISLPDGTSRGYLNAGDSVTIRAVARRDDGRCVGLGEVSGAVTPDAVAG